MDPLLLAERGDSTEVAFRHLDVLHRHAFDQPVLSQMNLIQ